VVENSSAFSEITVRNERLIGDGLVSVSDVVIVCFVSAKVHMSLDAHVVLIAGPIRASFYSCQNVKQLHADVPIAAVEQFNNKTPLNER
jgi:hypothetical protein